MDRQQFSSEFVNEPTVTSNNQTTGGSGKSNSLKRNIQFSHFATMESEEVLKAATEDLVRIFQLKVSRKKVYMCTCKCCCVGVCLYALHPSLIIQDASLLKGRIQLIEVPANSVLGLEGDLESCVYYIASGRLKVFRHTEEKRDTNLQVKE